MKALILVLVVEQETHSRSQGAFISDYHILHFFVNDLHPWSLKPCQLTTHKIQGQIITDLMRKGDPISQI
jgi:hypothetical protein